MSNRTAVFTGLLLTGDMVEIRLPVRRIVCPRCDGKGTHVNPDIDGHGISPEEFAEDPGFEEAYFSGRYDIRCEECDGRNVVDSIDQEEAEKTPAGRKALRRYWRYEDARAADRAESAWELRWCV